MSLDLGAIPPAPREPSARADALIFRHHGPQKIMLAVGAIFSGIGSLLALPFCWGVPADLAILAQSRSLHGRVSEAYVDRSTTINDRNPTVIRFVYSVDGERYLGQSSTLDDALIAAALPDASLPIEVSGLRPNWARVAGSTRSNFGYGGLVALAFPLIGLVIMGLVIRTNRRRIRAFVHGEPAAGKITWQGPDYRTTVNGRHPFIVRWEFRVADELHAGSLSSMDPLALGDLAKADDLVVLYDPADPSVNTAWVS